MQLKNTTEGEEKASRGKILLFAGKMQARNLVGVRCLVDLADQVVSELFSTAEFPLPASEMVRVRVTSEAVACGWAFFSVLSAEPKYQ